MRFEDLIPAGKTLHELTEEEIQEIVRRLEPDEMDRLRKEVKRIAKPKRTSKAAADRANEFDKALLQRKK